MSVLFLSSDVIFVSCYDVRSSTATHGNLRNSGFFEWTSIESWVPSYRTIYPDPLLCLTALSLLCHTGESKEVYCQLESMTIPQMFFFILFFLRIPRVIIPLVISPQNSLSSPKPPNFLLLFCSGGFFFFRYINYPFKSNTYKTQSTKFEV